MNKETSDLFDKEFVSQPDGDMWQTTSKEDIKAFIDKNFIPRKDVEGLRKDEKELDETHKMDRVEAVQATYKMAYNQCVTDITNL